MGAEGKALARVGEKVVFVTQAVPGDVVDIQVKRKRKSFMEGVITRYHRMSDIRQEPVCAHFGVCGGCKWQMLPYALQLEQKEKQVKDQLERIGGFKNLTVQPILGSPQSEFYRNKLEFTFSNKRWLTQDEINKEEPLASREAVGFHVPGLFDKVVDIDTCWLQPDPSNAIRNFIRGYAREHHLSFYDLREQQGFLRNLIIRTSSTGELMVILSVADHRDQELRALLDALMAAFPEITSLQYVINQKKNDTILDQELICYAGRDHIFEEMEGLRFKIGAKSFYQTNPAQAHALYRVALRFAGLTGSEVVYDLYTGTGTIANFLARQARHVVGIEAVPEAIADARENARLNRLTNTEFLVGDMRVVLNQALFDQSGYPDVIVLDPPRAGLHPQVIEVLNQAAAPRIVYVSCNPATQARDLALLAGRYTIREVQPVDMFPHTHHVENVVLLELTDQKD